MSRQLKRRSVLSLCESFLLRVAHYVRDRPTFTRASPLWKHCHLPRPKHSTCGKFSAVTDLRFHCLVLRRSGPLPHFATVQLPLMTILQKLRTLDTLGRKFYSSYNYILASCCTVLLNGHCRLCFSLRAALFYVDFHCLSLHVRPTWPSSGV
jgi:hypothetical protein